MNTLEKYEALRHANEDLQELLKEKQLEIDETDLRCAELEVDAARWNAFINSPFRLFGYAGLNHDNPLIPCNNSGKNGYAHFGCEMWTKHSGWKASAGKEILIGFADQAIKSGVDNERSNDDSNEKETS